MEMETALHIVSHLQNATDNLQQLVAEPKASFWDKATDKLRRMPSHVQPLPLAKQPLVVPIAGWATTHYSLAILDNWMGVLYVDGYMPQEVILDARVVKVMFSKAFAGAVGIKVANLARGPKFVTAGGAV